MRPGRFEELDAVRGIAALSVGVSHHLSLFESLPADGPFARERLVARVAKYAPTYPFSAGYESVILFFVLSGFVLSLPRIRGVPDSHAAFILRRITRLYLPYLAALAVAVLACNALQGWPCPPLGTWLTGHWTHRISLAEFASYAQMIAHSDVSAANPAMWSLVVEMRISLLFPAVVWVALRPPVRVAIAIAAGASLLRMGLGRFAHAPAAVEYLDTIHFFAVFVMGAVFARALPELAPRFARLSARSKAALFVVAWGAYAYGRALSHAVMFAADWLIVPATGVFFLFALETEAGRRFLGRRPVRFLGRISFSYYLVHAPVLMACFRLLHGKLPVSEIALVSLVSGVVFAALFYEAVERPSLALTKLVSRRLRPSSATMRTP